jgi:hypothetical protein
VALGEAEAVEDVAPPPEDSATASSPSEPAAAFDRRLDVERLVEALLAPDDEALDPEFAREARERDRALCAVLASALDVSA